MSNIQVKKPERVNRRMTVFGRSQTCAVLALFIGLTTLSSPLPGADDGDPNRLSRWPSFRGWNASGAADGSDLPTEWDGVTGEHVLWRTPIPGLGHSCPVVWDGRIFVTTAISSDADSEFRTSGMESLRGASAEDSSRHRWRVYCIDLRSGMVVWDRTAHEGVPRVKRHLKSSHANATIATDGRHVIAFFGSEGLYCYDLYGSLLWKNDLGVIDTGAFDNPDLQWGAGSSPILHADLVVVQCDQQQDSFLAAYAVGTGEEVWRVERDELPSWSTPVIWRNNDQTDLVTCSPQYSRGYDPLTGEERWRLGGHSSITVPTAVVGANLIFLADGYSRPGIRPIYAVRPGATGEISLSGDEESNEHIAWSALQDGPYLSSPILYRNHLYVCTTNGILRCYEADDGKQLYQVRLGGNYTASPVAADGKLYLVSEAGDISVVSAGPSFELLSKNPMGQTCLATPAIAEGILVVRTQHALCGITRTRPR